MEKAGRDVYRERLLNLRARLRGEMSQMEDAALNKNRNDGSSLPIHMADLGTENFDQELTLSLMGSEKEVLGKIEVALERIGEGTYDRCEECGKKIPEPRLEAIPYTTHCVNCASQFERRREHEEE